MSDNWPMLDIRYNWLGPPELSWRYRMSIKNELCVFQMLEQVTGLRGEPFTMTIGKLYEHLIAMDCLPEIQGDYVLCLMELGNVTGETDYRRFANNGMFSRRPLLTVQKFIEYYGG